MKQCVERNNIFNHTNSDGEKKKKKKFRIPKPSFKLEIKDNMLKIKYNMRTNVHFTR